MPLTPLQAKELYDAKAPVRSQFVPGDATVADLVHLDRTRVADITSSATGAQLQTAVNGILAILIAAGLMKSA